MLLKFCFKTEMKLSNQTSLSLALLTVAYPALLPIPTVQGKQQVIILQRDESELANNAIRKGSFLCFSMQIPTCLCSGLNVWM
jgi:hypothetical protein